MSRVILAGCVEKKQHTEERIPAKDLYVSPLFEKRRAYAEREVGVGRAVAWAVLSALHQCVPPDQPLPYYDWKMSSWRTSELAHWGTQVVASLRRDVLNCETPLDGLVVEIHAGVDYVSVAKPYLEQAGCIVTTPLKGLQIGEQLHWYKLDEQADEPYPQLEIA